MNKLNLLLFASILAIQVPIMTPSFAAPLPTEVQEESEDNLSAIDFENMNEMKLSDVPSTPRAHAKSIIDRQDSGDFTPTFFNAKNGKIVFSITKDKNTDHPEHIGSFVFTSSANKTKAIKSDLYLDKIKPRIGMETSAQQKVAREVAEGLRARQDKLSELERENAAKREELKKLKEKRKAEKDDETKQQWERDQEESAKEWQKRKDAEELARQRGEAGEQFANEGRQRIAAKIDAVTQSSETARTTLLEAQEKFKETLATTNDVNSQEVKDAQRALQAAKSKFTKENNERKSLNMPELEVTQIKAAELINQRKNQVETGQRSWDASLASHDQKVTAVTQSSETARTTLLEAQQKFKETLATTNDVNSQEVKDAQRALQTAESDFTQKNNERKSLNMPELEVTQIKVAELINQREAQVKTGQESWDEGNRLHDQRVAAQQKAVKASQELSDAQAALQRTVADPTIQDDDNLFSFTSSSKQKAINQANTAIHEATRQFNEANNNLVALGITALPTPTAGTGSSTTGATATTPAATGATSATIGETPTTTGTTSAATGTAANTPTQQPTAGTTGTGASTTGAFPGGSWNPLNWLSPQAPAQQPAAGTTPATGATPATTRTTPPTTGTTSATTGATPTTTGTTSAATGTAANTPTQQPTAGTTPATGATPPTTGTKETPPKASNFISSWFDKSTPTPNKTRVKPKYETNSSIAKTQKQNKTKVTQDWDDTMKKGKNKLSAIINDANSALSK